ncbi:PIN domain-containing protein [Brachybacterium muris]|nr:PIN domain-containing protein [Brachybacterium muris]MBM7501515.1 putative nucleic acid-binding protein [Brachybacterium muris]MCT1429518.1 PIN domain-containing protein [Brachybacterium muris]MCT1998022.1 PIN domain-containing protein [Brachybacterium muris]MCT2178442.1 PIN domain-containing protein [Brachybacterium muris]MCT2261317.1 PIN domain-containing protein [Brachybacterium muris]
MIVLDTNVISELFRSTPEPRVVERMMALTDDIAITSITLAELLAAD